MPRRAPQPRCLACAYPLGGLAGRRCPECGRPFDLRDPRTHRVRRRHLLAPTIVYVFGTPALAGALFALYMGCYDVIFDNSSAPLAPKLVVWILSFPLVYLGVFAANHVFLTLLAANVLLWAATLITLANLTRNLPHLLRATFR